MFETLAVWLDRLLVTSQPVLSRAAAIGIHPLPFGHPRSLQGRSTHWPTLQKHFIAANPVCMVSGMTKDLQVHHAMPFHLHPELELSWDNLRTVSQPYHFLIGHGCNWKKVNLDFDKHAREMRNMVEKLRNTPPETAARELIDWSKDRFPSLV